MYEMLDGKKRYALKLQRGLLVLDVSQDEDYPGLDIEYVAYDDNGTSASRPRVLIEAPVDEETNMQGNLRALVWANPDSEDYSDEIEFVDI